MRHAFPLCALLLAGCPASEVPGRPRPDGAASDAPPSDAAGRDLLLPDLAPDDLGPFTCSGIQCAPGQICIVFTPGMPPPPDMGNGYVYTCGTIPASCNGQAPSCGSYAPDYKPGCLISLCQGEPTCKWDGSILTCVGL